MRRGQEEACRETQWTMVKKSGSGLNNGFWPDFFKFFERKFAKTTANLKKSRIFANWKLWI